MNTPPLQHLWQTSVDIAIGGETNLDLILNSLFEELTHRAAVAGLRIQPHPRRLLLHLGPQSPRPWRPRWLHLTGRP